MKEFFDNRTARIFYDPELDTLVLEYMDKVRNDEQFIVINQAVLDAFRKLNTQKFVADIRKMGIIGVNSQRWVLENLLPGMIAHLKGRTLFHAQLLDPKEILSKVSAVNIQKKSKQELNGFDVKQFSDVCELKTYLKELKC
jgi:hypothetical protein